MSAKTNVFLSAAVLALSMGPAVADPRDGAIVSVTQGQASVNLGQHNGIKSQDTLEVLRDGADIGKLQVVSVEESSLVGTALPGTPDLKTGDVVRPLPPLLSPAPARVSPVKSPRNGEHLVEVNL